MNEETYIRVDRVEELKKRSGLTWDQIYEKSGAKYATVYALRKKRRPKSSPETIAKLAAAFDVSFGYLVGHTDNPKPHKEAGLSDEERDLLEIAKRLPPLRRAELLALARAVDQSQADADQLVVRIRDNYDAMAEGRTSEERVALLYQVSESLSQLVRGVSVDELMSRMRGVVDASGNEGAE